MRSVEFLFNGVHLSKKGIQNIPNFGFDSTQLRGNGNYFIPRLSSHLRSLTELRDIFGESCFQTRNQPSKWSRIKVAYHTCRVLMNASFCARCIYQSCRRISDASSRWERSLAFSSCTRYQTKQIGGFLRLCLLRQESFSLPIR